MPQDARMQVGLCFSLPNHLNHQSSINNLMLQFLLLWSISIWHLPLYIFHFKHQLWHAHCNITYTVHWFVASSMCYVMATSRICLHYSLLLTASCYSLFNHIHNNPLLLHSNFQPTFGVLFSLNDAINIYGIYSAAS